MKEISGGHRVTVRRETRCHCLAVVRWDNSGEYGEVGGTAISVTHLVNDTHGNSK